MTGELIYLIGKAVYHLPCLYENKIGNKWSSDKNPEGFYFEGEEYM